MPICPWCAEHVPAGTTICPECDEDTRNDPHRRTDDDEAGNAWLVPVRTSGWAIAAGYLGLFSLTVFPAPISLIVSIIAIFHLRANPKLHGWGRAIFGLIMGLILTSIVVFLAIDSLLM